MFAKEFDVDTADTLEATLERLTSHTYDLLMLCHSLSEEESQTISAAGLSRSPATHILQLTNGLGDNRAYIEPEEQSSSTRPQSLVRKVAQMMEKAPASDPGRSDTSVAS